MHLKKILVGLATSVLLVAMVACNVEKKPESTSEKDSKVNVQINTGEKGAFERLGQHMDEGAKKVDKSLEKGAENLGEAMEKAGQHLQETAEEAQARRAREEAAKSVPKVDVNVTVEPPKSQ